MSAADATAPARRGHPTRQIIAITAAAVALYVVVRQLPTGTNLSHTDFRVSGGNSIEFCDPANPQFIPVVAVQSPVEMKVRVTDGPAEVGRALQAEANLVTSTGKPIAPEDLLVTHTRKLHLLVLDPELKDYQHVHPEPVPGKPGAWSFRFTPHAAGAYRVFADFTPIATARGLYASADLVVKPTASSALGRAAEAAAGAASDYVFRLVPAATPIRANTVADFQFSATGRNGEKVSLEPVMDAFAHLVAVDERRTGFAHLHPAQVVDVSSPGAQNTYSALNFKVTIPKPGRYVIWAQVRIGGLDRYAPFWFDVLP
jgi:hypothetical protein